MSDLVIREKDGWEELENFHDVVRGGDLHAIWAAAATSGHRPRGDLDEVANLLDELGYDLTSTSRRELELTGFRIIAEPDDIHGDFYRAWVKLK